MATTYEKVSDLEVKIRTEEVVVSEKVIAIPELRQELLNANNAIEGAQRELDRLVAVKTKIETQLSEAQKIGVSESKDVGDPIREEGSPDPEVVTP